MGRTIDSGWGDDDELSDGGLDLSRGGSVSHAQGPTAYAGGGLSLGDDDDPFADEVPAGALELDLPSHAGARAGSAGSLAPAVPVAEPRRYGSTPNLAAVKSEPRLPAAGKSDPGPAPIPQRRPLQPTSRPPRPRLRPRQEPPSRRIPRR